MAPIWQEVNSVLCSIATNQLFRGRQQIGELYGINCSPPQYSFVDGCMGMKIDDFEDYVIDNRNKSAVQN